VSEQKQPAPAEQMPALLRGAEATYSAEELEQRLVDAAKAGRPLRVKFGMDPTAPDIHLGHTVVMGKMRTFQDLGHKAVLIIGDYTARVGDPSGVDHTRPVLNEEQIRENAHTYFEQAGKVLDLSEERIEIRYNSEWLAGLSFADVLRLASNMTVARMLERDSFERRYKAGDPVGIHEFLYPLMQAYDSVAIKADVELGGTDQTFNCLVGRTLMSLPGYQLMAQAEPQVVLTMPLLVGLDGTEKMSKSKGNYVGVTDSPRDMFGKLMSIPDRLMENYFTLLTTVPLDEVRETLRTEHPRDAKERLARTVTARYHGEASADAAAEDFKRVFADHEQPSDIPETRLSPADLHRDADTGRVGLASCLTAAGLTGSNSEAMRLIKQGAVWLDDQQVTDPKAAVDPAAAGGSVLRVGKKKWTRLQFEDAPDAR
jgi:tyrosyl-tRNA synthetase